MRTNWSEADEAEIRRDRAEEWRRDLLDAQRFDLASGERAREQAQAEAILKVIEYSDISDDAWYALEKMTPEEIICWFDGAEGSNEEEVSVKFEKELRAFEEFVEKEKAND